MTKLLNKNKFKTKNFPGLKFSECKIKNFAFNKIVSQNNG